MNSEASTVVVFFLLLAVVLRSYFCMSRSPFAQEYAQAHTHADDVIHSTNNGVTLFS